MPESLSLIQNAPAVAPGAQVATHAAAQGAIQSAVQSGATASARLTPIDTLRGVAMMGMALDHAAHFVGVSLQAETYGGQAAQLPTWPYWTAGLFTNLAAPIFWTLSGVSAYLYATARERRGESQAAITRFFLIRAAVLIVLDLTVCSWFWRGNGPYLHVLLSIGTGLALLSLLRLLGTRVVLAVGLATLLLYQAFLGPIAAQFSQSTSFPAAFLLGYSTQTTPAVEFSILGWSGLLAVGYGLGPWFTTQRAQSARSWLAIGAGMLILWLGLRLTGSFGDLVAFRQGDPLYTLVILGKTPPAFTYIAFNLGIASLLFAVFWALRAHLVREPMRWLTVVGQVALFFYVGHIVVYALLATAAPAGWFDGNPLPALIPALLFWLAGLGLLVPLSAAYRRLKRARPQSMLRYL